MQAAILKYAAQSRYSTAERCDIIELSNSAADPALSIAQAIVAPGVTTQWHCVVDTVERYVIQSGQGVVEVGDLPPSAVSAGDVVLIPASLRQRITNTGEEDLIFLAVCTPRFQHSNYRELGSP